MYFIHIQFKYQKSDISMRFILMEEIVVFRKFVFPSHQHIVIFYTTKIFYQKTFNQGQALVFKRPHIQIGKNEYSTINTSIRNAVQNNYMIHFSKKEYLSLTNMAFCFACTESNDMRNLFSFFLNSSHSFAYSSWYEYHLKRR